MRALSLISISVGASLLAGCMARRGPHPDAATSGGIAALGCGDERSAEDGVASARAYLFPVGLRAEDSAVTARVRAERYPGLTSPAGITSVETPAECARVLAALARDVPDRRLTDSAGPGAGARGGHTFAVLRAGVTYVVVVHPRTPTFDGGCLYIAPARTLRFGRTCYQGWA
jgi:hypothetical protein